MKYLAALVLLSLSSQVYALDIKRVYESSPSHVRVLVEIDTEGFVKCALYDKDENPIVVESQFVNPPLDELILRTGEMTKLVKGAKCWPGK